MTDMVQPLTDALKAFIKSTQAYVNGVVRGIIQRNIMVEDKSANSLYLTKLSDLHFSRYLDQHAAIDLSNFGDYR